MLKSTQSPFSDTPREYSTATALPLHAGGSLCAARDVEGCCVGVEMFHIFLFLSKVGSVCFVWFVFSSFEGFLLLLASVPQTGGERGSFGGVPPIALFLCGDFCSLARRANFCEGGAPRFSGSKTEAGGSQINFLCRFFVQTRQGPFLPRRV